jgi:hypothetical protein
MKQFILIITILLITVSCTRREYKTEYKQDVTTGKLALVVEDNQDPVIHDFDITPFHHVKVILIDDHQYVLATTNRGVAITHHAGCRNHN